MRQKEDYEVNRERAKELLPIIQAYAEGKQIEFRPKGEYHWLPSTTPTWTDDVKYRIKPEDPKSRRMTYRELAEWLAKGKGQCALNCSKYITSMEYEPRWNEEELLDGYMLRRWGSNEWIEPTYDVYAEDCMHVIQTIYD